MVKLFLVLSRLSQVHSWCAIEFTTSDLDFCDFHFPFLFFTFFLFKEVVCVWNLEEKKHKWTSVRANPSLVFLPLHLLAQGLRDLWPPENDFCPYLALSHVFENEVSELVSPSLFHGSTRKQNVKELRDENS